MNSLKEQGPWEGKVSLSKSGIRATFGTALQIVIHKEKWETFWRAFSITDEVRGNE